MHPVLQYILGFLGGGLIGAVPAAFVYLIARLFRRGHGTRLEVTFGVAALVGLAMCVVGDVMGSRALVSASVLLWGWLALLVVLFLIVMVWRVVAWCLGGRPCPNSRDVTPENQSD